MPWKEVTAVSLRKEFIALALLPDSNISDLSRRFGISRKTAYKWLQPVFQRLFHQHRYADIYHAELTCNIAWLKLKPFFTIYISCLCTSTRLNYSGLSGSRSAANPGLYRLSLSL